MKKTLRRMALAAAAILSVMAVAASAAGTDLTAENAKAMADQYVPAGSTHVGTKDDGKHLELYYYHEGNQEQYEVEVSRLTGTITAFDSDRVGALGGASATLGESGAQAAVTGEFPSAAITSTRLDLEDGYWVYDITFQSGRCQGEYTVNAQSGAVLEREIKISAASAADQQNAQLISLAQARQLALAQVPGATITELSLEREGGLYFYEAQAYAGTTLHDLAFDAVSGQLVWSSTRALGTAAGKTPAAGGQAGSSAATQYISAQKAQEIARSLAQQPSALVTKCKQEFDDGRMVYEVELRNGRWEYDFEIDAVTGAVLDWDQDYDD